MGAFPLIYLGWAYLFWTPLWLSESSVWSWPNILFFLLGGASPLVAGLALAWQAGGTAQLRDLGWRLIDAGRIGARWWLVIVLFWLVFNLILAAAALVLQVTDRPFDVDSGLLTDPGALAFLLLLSFVFPAVEEVGLRGYYLEFLQQRFRAFPAGLINGCVWALWHAPFVAFPGYYAHTTFQPELFWWLPMIVCTTLLIVQVYNATGRSILAVLIFHAMMNFTGEVLGITSGMYPFVLSGYVLAALAVVLFWRREGS